MSKKFMRKWQRKCSRSHVSLHRREKPALKRRDTCTQQSSDRSSHTNSARDTSRTNARTRSWNSSRISLICRSRIYALSATYSRRVFISFSTSRRRYHSSNCIWRCCRQRHEWDYTKEDITFLRKHTAIKSNASSRSRANESDSTSCVRRKKKSFYSKTNSSIRRLKSYWVSNERESEMNIKRRTSAESAWRWRSKSSKSVSNFMTSSSKLKAVWSRKCESIASIWRIIYFIAEFSRSSFRLARATDSDKSRNT
jgi:hypothetical protein